MQNRLPMNATAANNTIKHPQSHVPWVLTRHSDLTFPRALTHGRKNSTGKSTSKMHPKGGCAGAVSA